jgi:S-formylglutathione hydrolase FrmB
MNRIGLSAAIVLLLAATAPAQNPCDRPSWPGVPRSAPPSARVATETVDGIPVSVLLPPGYDLSSEVRYPVLYIFHGGVQWHEAYLALSDIETFTAALPPQEQAIVVMPDGGLGVYSNPRDGSPGWESFHVEKLIPFIDARYRTLADRAHRAAAGESAGGRGAMLYAARHPDLFIAAGSFSGVLDLMDAKPGNPAWLFAVVAAWYAACGDAPNSSAPFGDPVTDEVWWRNLNPTDLAPNLGGVAVYAATGNGIPCKPEDVLAYQRLYPLLEPVMYSSTVNFVAALQDAGVAHTSEFAVCGVHEFDYFSHSLHQFWSIMFSAFGAAPPRSFDFRSAESRFSVWGWTFGADPSRATEFLDVADASCAGVGLTGSGSTAVTTARCFTPGENVALAGAVEPSGNADSEGRITFHVDLGPPHEHQQYTVPVRTLEAAGGYWTSRMISIRGGD